MRLGTPANRQSTIGNQHISFTLIELLVVVAITAVLAGLLLPALQQSRESARHAVCGTQLRSIGMGLSMYADAYNGKYPKRWLRSYAGQELWYLVSIARHWDTLAPNRPEGTGLVQYYFKDPAIMYCPSYPYKDWPEGARIGDDGWANSVSYSVWSWSDWSWENGEHHSMVYRVAQDVNSEPATFIISDRVDFYYSWFLTANHPPNSSMTDFSCTGGNVLYNDSSVKWLRVQKWGGPIYTSYFYPKGP
jgi:prepilin-type N-terminal cleavage/methylation domain-containing protein